MLVDMDFVVGKWQLHTYVSMNLLGLQENTYKITHKVNVLN